MATLGVIRRSALREQISSVSVSMCEWPNVLSTRHGYPVAQGVVVDRVGAISDYRYELLGHLLSGNLFVEPYLVTLLPSVDPYATFQHPELKFLYFLSGEVSYRYGAKGGHGESRELVVVRGDGTAWHRGDSGGPMSVVFTLRE